jgi:hypothetical protein
MPPDSSDSTPTPTAAVVRTAPPLPLGLRLRLDPTPSNVGRLDGGWWPRSRDPDAELPELIAGLESAGGPITRVALNLDAWDRAPRRVAVDGRRLRVGWFRTMDPNVIGLTRVAFQERLALLVVPPQATTVAAGIAMAMAADPTHSAGPADILAAAGIDADAQSSALPPTTATPLGAATG